MEKFSTSCNFHTKAAGELRLFDKNGLDEANAFVFEAASNSKDSQSYSSFPVVVVKLNGL